MPPPPRRPTLTLHQWALCATALGAVLRLIVFLQRRPLWIDEAMIALNLGRRSVGGLLAPLDWDQVAPVGWLVLERALAHTLGMQEWSLRIPALVAGIATPWIVWRVGRSVVGEHAALIATVLIATNAALIYHANDAKPYALDAIVAIALLGAAWAVITADTVSHRRRASWRFALLGVLGTLFSLPAILVLAGLGALLLGVAIRRRDRSMAATCLATGGLWIVAFVPPWLTAYRPATIDPAMRAFWSEAMAGLGTPGFVDRVGVLLSAPARLLTTAPHWHAWPVVLLVLAVGAALLWTGGRRTALALIASPLAVLGLGWLADQVAAGERVSLWLVPSLTMLTAYAIAAVAKTTRGARALAITLVAALAISGAVTGVRRGSPNGGRTLIDGVLASAPAVVYLSPGAVPHWLVATTDWVRPDRRRLDALAALGSAGGPLFHNTGERRLAAIVPDRHDGPVPREILGRPGGMRIEYSRSSDLGPIAGWGEAEARRIAAHAPQGVHVLLIFAQAAERDALANGLRTVGAVVYECGTDRRAWWWYVGSDPPPNCTMPLDEPPA